MRKYNIREKEFLKLLEEISKEDLEFFSFFMQKKYFTKHKSSFLIIIPEKKKALFYIQKSIFDNLSLRKQEIKNFIEILSLIEYLKQNRLIDIIPNPQAQNTGIHFMNEDFDSPRQTSPSLNIILNKKQSYLKMSDFKIYDINDKVLFEAVELEKYTYDIIMDNLMGLLFVSEELNDFVRRGFKSIDDIRYKYGQIATWVSISIALIFGILGIYSTQSDNQIKNLKIDSQQFDSIVYYQKELKNSLIIMQETLERKNQIDSISNKY